MYASDNVFTHVKELLSWKNYSIYILQSVFTHIKPLVLHIVDMIWYCFVLISSDSSTFLATMEIETINGTSAEFSDDLTNRESVRFIMMESDICNMVGSIIFHVLRILLYDWSKVNHVMKDSSPIIYGRSKKFVTLCR